MCKARAISCFDCSVYISKQSGQSGFVSTLAQCQYLLLTRANACGGFTSNFSSLGAVVLDEFLTNRSCQRGISTQVLSVPLDVPNVVIWCSHIPDLLFDGCSMRLQMGVQLTPCFFQRSQG